jgi:hypothetical protein
MKDIAIAVLGGSLALASVLVVFVGFLIAHAEAMPATTPDRIQKRYRLSARWGLAPLIGAAMVSLASYAWLMCPTLTGFYWAWSLGFPLVVSVFIFYAVVAIWMI